MLPGALNSKIQKQIRARGAPLDFLPAVKQTPSTVRIYSTCYMEHVGPTSGTRDTFSPSEHTSRERTEALRWRSVFDNSAIGVAIADLNGHVLATNATYQKMLGYSESEFEGISFIEITHEDYREANWALVTELLNGKRDQFQIEKQYRRKDGSLVWVRNNVSLVRDPASAPRFMLALSEDITERKQAEAALQESEERLRKSEQRQHTLLEINNAIITNLTRDALFASAYEAIRRVVSFDRAAFLLYQPESYTLKLLSLDGLTESDFFRVGKEYDLRESRISAWVLENQKVATRGDLKHEQESANEKRLVAEGIQSYCVVPLVAMGKSIGTFAVWSETANRYTESDAELLREVANQVALAIANMKSYEEIASLKAQLEKECVYLQEEIRCEHNFEEIVGDSPALLTLLRQVDQVAPADSTVLIYGETGTGKELIARAIHDRSHRKNRPLVKVNCSAISAGLVESELFGHAKGAFTGAFERRIGRFELADGGTIFLDEVGELPLDTQVKLLRVLQEREFEPVGSNRSVRVDVRIICATNRNLEEAIAAGTFRSDLYYRLNVFPLEVPPLRERRADIDQLAKFFVSRFARKLGKNITGISEATTEKLLSYSWPGNIRELQNVIERALILASGPTLDLENDLASIPTSQVSDEPPLEVEAVLPYADEPPLKTLQEVERAHILAVLQQTHGVIEGSNGAAKTLGMHPNTLRHRMEKLGIKRQAHRIS